MCGFDPVQSLNNAIDRGAKAVGKVGKAAETIRAKGTALVEGLGKHGTPQDPQAALDAASAAAQADQIKAQQQATIDANATLLAQKRRRRAQAGLLSTDSTNGSVLSTGAPVGSGNVLSTGAVA